MRIRIKKSKSGGMLADYLNILDKKKFRYSLLKKVLGDFGYEAALFIDTNQSNGVSSSEKVLAGFEEEAIAPLVIRVAANPQKFFGFSVSLFNKNTVECLVVAELKGRELSEQLFEALSDYDICIGIGQKHPVSNQNGELSLDGITAFVSCFEKHIYDSIVCDRINSSFDISHYIEEVANEMGL